MSEILASEPTVVAPTTAATYDKWAVLNLSVNAQLDRTQPISLYVSFVKYRDIKDEADNVIGYETNPNAQTSYTISDVFGAETVANNPEIPGAILQILPILDLVGKRLGKL